MQNSFSLRLTPHPFNQVNSGYSASFLSSLFKNKASFIKVLMFEEEDPIHFHIFLYSTIGDSAIRKWIKKWLPKLKGNAYFSIHPCDNCKKHTTCSYSAKTYVSKEGKHLLSKGFNTTQVCEYVSVGKELLVTARLTSNDSRRLLHIGKLYQETPHLLSQHIISWYEKQSQTPPSKTHIRTLIRQIMYKYNADFRRAYATALDEIVLEVRTYPL